MSSNTSNQDAPSVISSLEHRSYGLGANGNDTRPMTSPSGTEKFATNNSTFSAQKDPLSGLFQTPLSGVRVETSQTAISPGRVSSLKLRPSLADDFSPLTSFQRYPSISVGHCQAFIRLFLMMSLDRCRMFQFDHPTTVLIQFSRT